MSVCLVGKSGTAPTARADIYCATVTTKITKLSFTNCAGADGTVKTWIKRGAVSTATDCGLELLAGKGGLSDAIAGAVLNRGDCIQAEASAAGVTYDLAGGKIA